VSKRRFDETWSENVTLRDGSTVELRLLRPDDRAELYAAFRRLSPESRYRRFFSDAVDLTPEMLDYLTLLDGYDHFAIVAHRASADLKSDVGIGVARFIRLKREPTVAEAAITVTDDAQGIGLGRVLLARLREAALERDVACFRTSLLGTNDAMAKLVESGFIHESDGTVIVIDVQLAEPSEPGLYKLLRMAATSVATWVRWLGLPVPPVPPPG
jgi:GNAT superfamily N-acetyltransferase